MKINKIFKNELEKRRMKTEKKRIGLKKQKKKKKRE
jgi:hypothetical protein